MSRQLRWPSASFGLSITFDRGAGRSPPSPTELHLLKSGDQKGSPTERRCVIHLRSPGVLPDDDGGGLLSGIGRESRGAGRNRTGE